MSRRFGPDNKLLAPWGETTVLGKVLSVLSSLPFEEMILVTGHESVLVEATTGDYPVRRVFNADYESGMGSSIACGVGACSGASEGFLIVLGDMPGITRTAISRILACTNPTQIVVPVFQGREGNPVCFGSHYRSDLLALDGDRGARSVVQANDARVVRVKVDEQTLEDLDEPGQ